MAAQSPLLAPFRTTLERFKSSYPHVATSLVKSPQGVELTIPACDENGFSLFIELIDEEVVFHCEQFHEHFHNDEGLSSKDFVDHLFGIIYDYLTSKVRLTVVHSNNKPYRWTVELEENGDWVEQQTMSLILYNFFGKKSTRHYQNTQLPIR